MITIQQLLDLGILNDNNYMCTYDDKYDKIVDYAFKFENEYNNHFIVLQVATEDGLFKVTIMPDGHLISMYTSSINRELIDTVQIIKDKCVSISCKECPYYMNVDPDGEPFKNCKLTKSAPYLW